VWQGAGVERVVVVGGSLAGLRAIETLRNDGFEGAVTLIGAETRQPYDRPPLSKKVLAGEWEPERIALRRDGDLGSLDVDARLGRAATGLDVQERVVTVDDGERVPYDGLVIATGATVRRLPEQPELDGVHMLRTLDDSLALRAALTTGSPRVVVVGAGFIGSEVAATARGLGCEVTVLEALPVPLARALGPRMGQACSELHGDHGVELRLGVGVAAIEGTDRVERVRLTDGSAVPADVVVVGIGVAPATGWLEGSGLELRDGVVCDATLAAGPPGVYAAGDVCRWPNPLFDEEMRVEHWTNAAEQGAHAARSLLAATAGQPAAPYAPVLFFWSDQYGQRIQFLGRAGPDDEVRLVSGSVEDRGFVALYGRGGRLRGVLGLSRPKLVMPYQKLLAAGATWDDALAHAAAAG
jgi:NADPH-dependent 2,4-dienoyl-CoA reductase/sulfur reductase-like enzyme